MRAYCERTVHAMPVLCMFCDWFCDCSGTITVQVLRTYLIVIPGAYILAGSNRKPAKLSERYLMNITAPRESTPIEAKELESLGRLPLT